MKHDKDQVVTAITDHDGNVDLRDLCQQLNRPYPTLHNWVVNSGIFMKRCKITPKSARRLVEMSNKRRRHTRKTPTEAPQKPTEAALFADAGASITVSQKAADRLTALSALIGADKKDLATKVIEDYCDNLVKGIQA